MTMSADVSPVISRLGLPESRAESLVAAGTVTVLAVADLFLRRVVEELQGKVRGDEELVEIVRRQL